MLQKIKTWMLPLAMLSGAFFYEFFQQLAFLTPYLIFSMLFITYCKLSFRDLKFSGLHLWLLAVQVVGCLVVYGGLVWFDPVVAQGGLICVLAPTATAAAVITGMLGGSVACLAAYTLMSSLVVAVVSPLIFTLLGEHSDMTFWNSVLFHLPASHACPDITFCIGPVFGESFAVSPPAVEKTANSFFLSLGVGIDYCNRENGLFYRVSGECRYYGRVVDGRISIGDLCPAVYPGQAYRTAVWRSCFGRAGTRTEKYHPGYLDGTGISEPSFLHRSCFVCAVAKYDQ